MHFQTGQKRAEQKEKRTLFHAKTGTLSLFLAAIPLPIANVTFESALQAQDTPKGYPSSKKVTCRLGLESRGRPDSSATLPARASPG